MAYVVKKKERHLLLREVKSSNHIMGERERERERERESTHTHTHTDKQRQTNYKEHIRNKTRLTSSCRQYRTEWVQSSVFQSNQST